MRRTSPAWAGAFIGIAVLSACGGRGSGGFDIENAAIKHALATGECVGAPGVKICPADATAAPTPGSGTPTPAPTPVLSTSLRDATTVECAKSAPRGPCRFDFTFTATNFPPATVFHIALRGLGPATPWERQPDPLLTADGEPQTYMASAEVSQLLQSLGQQVQVVVLVYMNGDGETPAVFADLVDSGADLVFVSFGIVPLVEAIPIPTPTATPVPGSEGPLLSFLGIATTAGHPIESSGTDAVGRPVVVVPSPVGVRLVVEAQPGPRGRAVGRLAYRADGAWPDLQVLVDRPLGDGSAAVCDIGLPRAGGVPAEEDLAFVTRPSVLAAVNDLGCRVNDGTGEPLGQRDPELGCTLRGESPGFVDPASTVQFCLPIAVAWTFQAGDTVVAARVQDIDAAPGLAREIVVRVPSTSP